MWAKSNEGQQIYGLIGYPLGHSFSKDYFNKKFSLLRLNAIYENFELSSAHSFSELIQRFPNLCGLNVTLPYKEAIIPYLDALSPESKAIQAVNVIRFTPQGLIGYNSDYYGFMTSLRPLMRPFDRHAVVLGTGGAARAVAYALSLLDISVQFVSRTKRTGVITYEELAERKLLATTSLVIYCTPLGMFPHTTTFPPLPYQEISPYHLFYDLIYNPTETLFLSRGKEQGAMTKNGLEMLHLQAEKAWGIWQEPFDTSSF